MPAGLFLVPSARLDACANRLAIRNFRRLQRHLGVVALLQLGDDHLDMLLPGAGDQELMGLRVAIEANQRVFFHQPVQSGGQLVFIGAGARLDRKGDRRLGQYRRLIENRLRLVSQRVSGEGVLQLGDRANVARMQFRHGTSRPCLP